jgi:hypothetical protein
MSSGIKPGQTPGNKGGIYREQGPRGGATKNYATIPDNHRAPPTSQRGATWVPDRITPNSKR